MKTWPGRTLAVTNAVHSTRAPREIMATGEFGLMESSSSLGLFDAEDVLPGVVADDITDGDHSGSGLHTAFALGGLASLQSVPMARMTTRSPQKPR